jgi:hypothetical protein
LRQSPREQVGVLRPRDAVPQVDDEERHARDAVRPPPADVGLDVVGVGAPAERVEDQLPVQANLGGEVGEVLVMAEVASFDEVGPERALFSSGCRPCALARWSTWWALPVLVCCSTSKSWERPTDAASSVIWVSIWRTCATGMPL